MPISTLSNLLNLTKSDKWKIWRIINSVVILLSFFVPWLSMVGGPRDLVDAQIFTGFQVLELWWGLGLSFLSMNSIEQANIGRNLLLDYFSGLVAILIYCALSVLLTFLGTKLVDKLIWKIAAFFLILFGVRSLYWVASLDAGWDAFLYTFWGYWLVLIGLASSIIVEISYFLIKKSLQLWHL